MSSTIVGYFEQSSQAQQARMYLLGLGIPESDIHIFSGDPSPDLQSSSGSSTGESRDDESILDKVKNFFTPIVNRDESDKDSRYYADDIPRGGTTMTVVTDEFMLDRATKIMNQYGAAENRDERVEVERANVDRGGTTGVDYTPIV